MLCVCSAATGSSAVKRVGLDAIPQVGGQSLMDFDLDATDKPWRLPGLWGESSQTVCIKEFSFLSRHLQVLI